MTAPTGIALLGATGSIGETAQRVVARHPDRFRFVALTANGNRDGLRAAADRWAPEFVGLVEPGTDAERADRFHALVLASIADRLTPVQRESVATFSDFRASFHGLARHWRTMTPG